MWFNKLTETMVETMTIRANLQVVLSVLKADNLNREEIAVKVRIHLKMQIVSLHKRDQKLEEIKNQIKDNYFKV